MKQKKKQKRKTNNNINTDGKGAMQNTLHTETKWKKNKQNWITERQVKRNTKRQNRIINPRERVINKQEGDEYDDTRSGE